MGILQNIIKSINTAIDSIDLSLYQLISGKNTALKIGIKYVD